MAGRVSYGSFDLGYPPWCLEFDPYNRGYIVVGGGGGEGERILLQERYQANDFAGQKEVPNKLTLLSIAHQSHIEKVAELESLPDNPTSVAALTTKEGLIVFAGVNAPLESRKSGSNEHLRTYQVDYPKKGEEKLIGKITPLGSKQLFSETYCSLKNEAYQRLLRLSPVKKSGTATKRIGAIASSIAQESEVILFDVSTIEVTKPRVLANRNKKATKTSSPPVIQRIKPLQNAEAEDIDICETADGDFLVALCTTSEVYLSSVSWDFTKQKPKSPIVEPACIYSTPYPDAFAKRGRPKLRSIRFLTPDHVVLLTNSPDRSELQILRIHSGSSGEIILRKKLSRAVGKAVSLDVTLLDADESTGARQIIIAVASQTENITVFTLDYSGPTTNTVSSFTEFKELTRVHVGSPMKKVVLSPFYRPHGDQIRPQYVRLASISLSNNLCIDDLPLFPDSGVKGARYVLSKPNPIQSFFHFGGSVLAVGISLLVALLFFQSFISYSTGTSSMVKLPESWQQAISSYRDMAGQLSQPINDRVHKMADPAGQRLLDLLHLHHKENKHLPEPEKKVVVITVPEAEGAAPLAAQVHADTAEVLVKGSEARKWEDLSEKQQKRWKDRLTEAGQWSADYGETILKGVFFSEVAGAVGRAAAEALAG